MVEITFGNSGNLEVSLSVGDYSEDFDPSNGTLGQILDFGASVIVGINPIGRGSELTNNAIGLALGAEAASSDGFDMQAFGVAVSEDLEVRLTNLQNSYEASVAQVNESLKDDPVSLTEALSDLEKLYRDGISGLVGQSELILNGALAANTVLRPDADPFEPVLDAIEQQVEEDGSEYSSSDGRDNDTSPSPSVPRYITPETYELENDPLHEQVWEPEGIVRVEVRHYESGSMATTVTDSLGNGTHTITDANENSVSYDFSDEYGASIPIIFDLDGDGVEISFGENVYFDVDGDGFRENTGWVGEGDGFLVIDLNADGSRGAGDGQIELSNELVFSSWGDAGDTDLQALGRAFDDNSDGVLNNQDDVWDELRIWEDANQDGITDDGELRTLSQLGISEINLAYDDGSDFAETDDDITVFGNTLHGLASFTRNGVVVEGGVGDVSLRYETDGWRRVETALGYRIEIENGPTLSYAELDATTAADVNLTAEVLDGAVGDDRANSLNAFGFSRSVIIAGGGGNDVISGGHNNDTLSGGVGADVIHGRDGNDVIYIDANDLLNGSVTGGNGIDTLIVTDSGGGVDIDLLALTSEGAIGGAGGDTISGAGLYDDVMISGGGGHDIIVGGYGSDNLNGGDGNDIINGGNSGDVVNGGDGFDILRGQAGDDMIIGGNGKDTITGEGGDDNLFGGANDDRLWGGEHDDFINGGAGSDTLYGGKGDDVLIGEDGDDVLYFWQGDDQLFGGNGNDTFILSRDPAQYGAEGYWGWSQFQGGAGFDSVQLNANQEHFAITHVGGSQYQIVRQISADKKVVIDIQDIERIQFADGTEMLLASDPDVNTTGGFDRHSPNAAIGDTTGSLTTSGVLSGWTGNDLLSGSSYGDTIIGDTGSDTLSGGAGFDSLYGGSGADAILGGDGADSLYGESGDDEIHGNQGNDRIFGQVGSDRLYGGAGEDVLNGEAGTDILEGGDGHDQLFGGDDQDRLFGGNGGDTVDGGTGADTLYGEGGGDTLYGRHGTDEIYGGSHGDVLYGGDGFDVLYGEAGDDYLNGGQEDDILIGGDGNDTLVGGTSADILVGGAGADILDGGNGALDFASYENSQSHVVIDLQANVAMGGDAAGDSFANIENITASGFDDIIRGDDGDNVIEGLDGNDHLVGRDGHDIISGGAGNDTMFGGEGNDRFIGGIGRDTVDYFGGSTGAVVDLRNFDLNAGAAAGDTLFQVERLVGTDFSDRLLGDTGSNTLNGMAGDDILAGRNGDDLINGGSGDDLIYGGAGADTMNGNSGFDTASYALSMGEIQLDMNNVNFGTGDAAGDTLDSIESVVGSDFADDIRGNGEDNHFSGLEGRDTLWGHSGNDTLDGGTGSDILYGGGGNDVLTGGSYADEFRFNAAQNEGNDVITDFENGADLIRIEGATFNNLTIVGGSSGTTVSWANGSVELAGISSGAISEADFIFV